VGAARVEGDVPADGADRLATGVGGEVEAVGSGDAGDLQVDHAGLHDGQPFLRVEAQDAVQAVQGDHQPAFHRQRAARETGAAAPGDEGDLLPVAQADRRDDLLLGKRDDNGRGAGAERGEGVGFVGRQFGGAGEQAIARVHARERAYPSGRRGLSHAPPYLWST